MKLTKIVRRRKKRVGRGAGSGKGMHTSSRGQKGQTSRAGFNVKRAFEGGQKPVWRRIPKKRKMVKSKSVKRTALNIERLIAKKLTDISSEVIQKEFGKGNYKLVGTKDIDVKILKGVRVEAGVAITNTLKEKIVNAGGVVA